MSTFAETRRYSGFTGYSNLSNTAVMLQWKSDSKALVYNLFYETSSGESIFIDSINAPTLEFYVTGLSVGTTYTFKILMLDINGRINKSKKNLVVTTLSGPVVVTCPNNYTKVPMDKEMGTYSDFCVMAYEAKNIGGVATSVPDGAPWNNISMVNAKAACQAIGANYDLISNEEWMTIARNIESYGANWNSGIVGEGCLSRGNSGADNICGYFYDDVDYGTSRDFRAQFYLNNGESLWDFAGNLWEWVDWKQAGALDLAPVNCPAGWDELSDFLCPAISSEEYSPITEAMTSTDNGVGRFYGGTGGAAVRGGAWSSTINSGVFALYLKNRPTAVMNSVGFRCVYRP